jgi:hypothetical protein
LVVDELGVDKLARIFTIRSNVENPPLTHGHRDALLENGSVLFLGFSFTSVGPSVLISISSVIKSVIYPPDLPRYSISLDELATSLSLNGPDSAVPAMTNDATSDWLLRRPSASCQICSRALENWMLDRLLALLSVTMRTLPMSRTTFSPVSLAWKSKSAVLRVTILRGRWGQNRMMI